MRKYAFLSLVVITLLVLGGIVLGVGRMQVAPAHAQTLTVQTQSNNQQVNSSKQTHHNSAAVNGTENDPPDSGEKTGEDQDKNLPGGGHQDPAGADHQFEGSE